VTSIKLPSAYWKLWSATVISNLGDGVSLVAYPWLMSAITRSPFLIALVGVMSRLPWLLFTLPFGVLTDRVDRRKIIVAMDFMRGLLTLAVALVVFRTAKNLPGVNSLTHLSEQQTNLALFGFILVAAFLMGCAEVLRDNSAQTLMPSLVEDNALEKANGRMWSAESLTNSFIGPPLGSLLLGLAYFLPFAFDAASFFASSALIFLIAGNFKANKKAELEKTSFRVDLMEGFAWLWKHQLLRPMALILGSLNGIGALVGSVYILFAQEILHTSVFIFAILGTAGAIGGILGGVYGPRVASKIGSGTSLKIALIVGPVASLIIGFMSNWKIVFVLTVFEMFGAVLWNVITVSLRQSIIPPELLGRVNSVYRFFAWGSIPIGALIGGSLVSLNQHLFGREWALRSPYLIGSALGFIVLVFALPRLTTENIDRARKGN
jgi:MFS family permease